MGNRIPPLQAIEARLTRFDIMAKWTPWFAWFPVKINGRYRWLTTVYRRRIIFTEQGVNLSPPYDYGDIFDVLKDA